MEFTQEQQNSFLAPVDYSAAAAPLQGLLSQDLSLPMGQLKELAGVQQQINNVNTVNPYGSTKYSQNPDGSYTSTSVFSPEQQKLYNQSVGLTGQTNQLAQGMLGNLGNTLNQPLNFGKSILPTDFTAERNRIENELYGRQTKYLDLEKTSDRERMMQDLENRGIGRGSEGFRNAMDSFDKNWGDRYGDARTQAIQMGGNEMINSYNAAADARARSIEETLLKREQPMKELQGLLGGDYQSTATNMGSLLPQAGGQGGVNLMGTATDLMKMGSDRQLAAASGLSDIALAQGKDQSSKGMFALGEANRYQIAAEGNEAQKAAAGISAGASRYAAELNAAIGRQNLENNAKNDSFSNAITIQNLISGLPEEDRASAYDYFNQMGVNFG
jgi:hypothetical protein